MELVQAKAILVEHMPVLRSACATMCVSARRPGVTGRPLPNLATHPELRGAVSVVFPAHNEAANIPSSNLDETFNLATWNVREFGKKPRTNAAIHYIAEVMGQFDLIGLVGLRDDLRDLKLVLEVLGHYWTAVYSATVLDAVGNGERIA